jgi:gliding motility-associated-like protein
MHRLKWSSFILLSALATLGKSQGLINNGASIVVKNDAFLVVSGKAGNFTNQNNGTVNVNARGYIKIKANWSNLANNSVFVSNSGTVILYGDTQYIGGFYPTGFYNLDLTGGAPKVLNINTFVGGVYNYSRNGRLILNSTLILNSNRLIINNPKPSAVYKGIGYIISETDPISGYGTMQWNIRGSNNDSLYIFPFGTQNATYIPTVLNVKSAGIQIMDSGYLSLATYPTNAQLNPNNRPLPLGVNNFQNKYNVENGPQALDRFWVLGGDQFITLPDIDMVFSYRKSEWDATNSSTNTILGNELKAVKYDPTTQKWQYPGNGTSDPVLNRVYSGGMKNYLGNWVLSENPYCPIPDFTTLEKCYTVPFFFKDESTIPRFSITGWTWDFGDGQLSSVKDPVHRYENPGLYPVMLRVFSDKGCEDSVIYNIEAFTIPVADYEYLDTCYKTPTSFKSTSTDSKYLLTKTDWFFSDGTNSQGSSVSHQFAFVGNQFADLIVENSRGCRDTMRQSFIIQPLPFARFDVEPICENTTVDYTSASGSPSGIIIAYKWNFHNSFSSDLKDTSVFYSKADNYIIKHWVQNQYGCEDSIEKLLLVKQRAIANFDFEPKPATISTPIIRFTDKSSNTSIWEWDFGDFGFTENVQNPVHEYKDTGWYRVILIANNDVNCPDTIMKLVFIKPEVRVYLPNAFTPQGFDDLNSTFKPVGILNGTIEYTLQIFNRWGEMLYESDDIDKPWDGTIRDGKVQCQAGAYLYIIRLMDVNRELHVYKGTVNLIR